MHSFRQRSASDRSAYCCTVIERFDIQTSRLCSVLLYGKALSVEGIVRWPHEFGGIGTGEAPLESITNNGCAKPPCT